MIFLNHIRGLRAYKDFDEGDVMRGEGGMT